MRPDTAQPRTDEWTTQDIWAVFAFGVFLGLLIGFSFTL